MIEITYSIEESTARKILSDILNLQDAVNDAIVDAQKNNVSGSNSWGRFYCHDVAYCIDFMGNGYHSIKIEVPNKKYHDFYRFIRDYLMDKGFEKFELAINPPSVLGEVFEEIIENG